MTQRYTKQETAAHPRFAFLCALRGWKYPVGNLKKTLPSYPGNTARNGTKKYTVMGTKDIECSNDET